jgi:lipopolysaccharide transport system ATP-binding protein
MTAPIVVFDHVYKKFSRSANVGTLRDFIPLMASRMWPLRRRTRPRGEPGLSKSEFWAVHDVSFALARGETLGIIGPNGSGKSSTLKLLSRILKPDHGSYRVDGRLSALIEVGAGFHPDLTGRENVFLNCAIYGMSRREVRAKFDEIVDFAGVRDMIDAPVKHYSSGMAVRLGFATSVFTRPDVLLVDEVLAVGDMEFRSKCQARMRRLRAEGVSIILVSHNLSEIRGLCDRTLMLFSGRTEMEGPTKTVVEHYHQVISEKIAATRPEGPGDGASRRRGPSDVRLVRLELLDADGRPSDRFATGDSMTVRVHYDAPRRVERPRLRVDLAWTVGEVRCCAFDSRLEHVALPPLDGPGHIDLRLDQMLMAPDAYLASAHLDDDQTATPIDAIQKVPFRVTDGVAVPSFFGLPHAWVLPPVSSTSQAPILENVAR